MKRAFLVFCLSCVFIIPAFFSAQAENQPDLIDPGVSPEFWDSLMSGKGGEPTLQHLLDSLGYDIDVANDTLPTEVWVTIAGQYKEVMLAEFAGFASKTSSGWYKHGNPSSTHVIFGGANHPTDSAFFTITGCDSNGLFIKVPREDKCEDYYYTEKRLNSDHKDHAWVFCSKKRPNEFIVAWEDTRNLGDADFNDLVLIYQMPNRAPVLEIPVDTSFFLCEPETIRFNNIRAYDLDYCGDTVAISKVQGPGTYNAGTCCFLPAPVDSAYEFIFVATDWFGASDSDTVVITVDINDPPQLTCPDDDSLHTGDTLISTGFSVTDPDGDTASVIFLDINPTATNTPTIVANHVEWVTTCNENGDYVIRLVASDSCGATDTCEFTVNVYNQPPQLTCPDDDSVHAGDTLISTDFNSIDPDGDTAIVTFLDINPAATNTPTIVANHVEWITTCDEDGDYIIRLVATDSCGAKDTCYFQVTVYDQPPQITCPDDDTVDSGHYLSGNFTVDDPDGDSVTGINAWVDPAGTGVTNLSAQGGTGAVPTTGHVEFDADSLFPGDYTIYLEATSGCETKDTCSFLITIPGRPPVITSTPDTTAFVGQLYTYDVDATGIPAPVFHLFTYPTGMTIDTITGLIQWTPTAVGDSDVCVEAINSAGADTQCFTISVAESAQVSILPEVLPIQCSHEDTLWIHLDGKVVDMDSAFFKIAYEDTLITPDTVIEGPALVPPGNFDLSYGIYPDSILISLAVLSGSFDGPDTILGIVFTAGNYITTAQLNIERSSLHNSEGEEIPHRTTGAEIQIDCQTSVNGEEEETSGKPSTYALSQNHPNPYNPETQITYQLPQPGVVSLKIYNIKGQLVRTLVNEYKPAGIHSIVWDGKNDLGMEVASGIYFYRMQADKFADTKKMILMR